MNQRRFQLLTSIDDRLLAMAGAPDPPVEPDREGFWSCCGCGFGCSAPPGKIITVEKYDVVTDGKCKKCGGTKFERSMLANK